MLLGWLFPLPLRYVIPIEVQEINVNMHPGGRPVASVITTKLLVSTMYMNAGFNYKDWSTDGVSVIELAGWHQVIMKGEAY